jgi:hypothetical protein
MSSSQDRSAVGTGTSGAAADTPSAPAGETSGQAPTGETASTYVPRHVPRPAPGYDDTVDYAAAGQSGQSGPSGAALGFTAMAAILMMLSGGANILEGIAAVIRASYFVTLPNYAFNTSVTGWGWTHLIFGVVVFLAGACLFLDMLWARVAGVRVNGPWSHPSGQWHPPQAASTARPAALPG